LLASGKGIVFLHHAIAGWPAWPEYGDWTGARFLYAPGTARGRNYPDSGYRHDVKHFVKPVDPKHPIAAGIEAGYEISDELYLCPVFEELVTPLMRSSHAFVPESFYSAAAAIAGKMFSNEGWTHPAGSNLAAWAQRIGRSQTATILGGDGPAAYENPGYRRLVENAIRWVVDETRSLTSSRA
ncbi:MAG TPA: ThuA domain-containing protein, partial [Myxococcota bacterium]|nr:ThuA domain-containing protein [Myxococcota bacterium]